MTKGTVGSSIFEVGVAIVYTSYRLINLLFPFIFPDCGHVRDIQAIHVPSVGGQGTGCRQFPSGRHSDWSPRVPIPVKTPIKPIIRCESGQALSSVGGRSLIRLLLGPPRTVGQPNAPRFVVVARPEPWKALCHAGARAQRICPSVNMRLVHLLGPNGAINVGDCSMMYRN